MNEFMGLVTGSHDAKAEEFTFCGASLHNCMAGHDPDTATFETASNAKLKPAINLYKKLGFKRIVGERSPYERCNIQMLLTFFD